jgi:hypothetical protein
MGKKMGNARSHPNWPDTILEAKTILDLVDNSMEVPEAAPVEDQELHALAGIPGAFAEDMAAAGVELVDQQLVDDAEEPSAEAEGDDVDLDDLL